MRTRWLALICVPLLASCRAATNEDAPAAASKPASSPSTQEPAPAEPPAPSGPAFVACPGIVPSQRPIVRPDDEPTLALPRRLIAPLGDLVSRNHELFDPDCDGRPEAVVIAVSDPAASEPELSFAYVDDDLHVDLGAVVTEQVGADAPIDALALLIPREGAPLVGMSASGRWLFGRVGADGKFTQLGEALGEHGECRGSPSPWLDEQGFFRGFEVGGCGYLGIDTESGALTEYAYDAAPKLELTRWPGVPLPPLPGKPELPPGIDLDSCERHPKKPRLDCGEFTLLGSVSSMTAEDWRSQYERLSGATGLSLTWEPVSPTWPGFDDAKVMLARSSKEGRPVGLEFIVFWDQGDKRRVGQCMSMLSGRGNNRHTLARAQSSCAAAVARVQDL